jgi:hypothetical protein
MKKLIVGFLATGFLLTMPLQSMALDTATINVQAEILGVCTIQASPALMDFGLIDPGTYVTTALPGTVDFTCTTGVAYSIDFAGVVAPANGSAVARNMNDGLGNLLPYTVNTASDPTGLGTGAVAISYDFDVTLAAADVATALAGVYTDSFTFDITP